MVSTFHRLQARQQHALQVSNNHSLCSDAQRTKAVATTVTGRAPAFNQHSSLANRREERDVPHESTKSSPLPALPHHLGISYRMMSSKRLYRS